MGRDEERQVLDRAPAGELSLPEAMRLAVEGQRGGQVEAAAEIYRRVLARAPDHVDALQFLGIALHQLGRSEEGVSTLRRALEVDPACEGAHNNLGNVLKEMGRAAEAELAYRRVVQLNPANADALNNLGVALKEQARLDEAVAAYRRAIALQPRHADAWHNLGNALKKAGQIDEALSAYGEAIRLRPYHAEAYRNLARTLYAVGRAGDATDVYRQWLTREPDNPVPRHMLAAGSGQEVPACAAAEYVVATFDGFAASFDEVLKRLDYRAPALVADGVRRVVGEPTGRLQVLDAGCGTGQCGPLLKAHSRRLTGVDLSPKMLDKARGRGVYDELVTAELVVYLSGAPETFDLVASADTLCYFGALGPVLAAAARSLRPGGGLVFTLEAAPADEAKGYRLEPHGRYSHSLAYVSRTLAGVGLRLLASEETVLRNEGAKPVAGLIVIARHGDPDPSGSGR
jgi:predicted TPR repeat methyltransferase